LLWFLCIISLSLLFLFFIFFSLFRFLSSLFFPQFFFSFLIPFCLLLFFFPSPLQNCPPFLSIPLSIYSQRERE
jgi:hypothetical protein